MKALIAYLELDDIDPRIVLYSDVPEEIQEILGALARNPEWVTIENHREAFFQLFRQEPPIRGTTHFTDTNGRNWKTLTFNSERGYSEDLVDTEEK